MDKYEYVISGPIVLIHDRRTMGKGCLYAKWDGQEFAIAFTDKDLAYRYYEGNGKPDWMDFGVLDTPADFIGFLELAEKSGWINIGFDPNSSNRPQRIMPIRVAIEEARKAFPEQ